MLHSAFLRRTVACLGIGAIGTAPALPFAAIALFGASTPAVKASADFRLPIRGIIDPADIEDGTGGTGGFPIFPPFPPLPIIPPEDVDDGTGGIGGSLP